MRATFNATGARSRYRLDGRIGVRNVSPRPKSGDSLRPARRLLALAMILLALCAAVIVRLVNLQAISAGRYASVGQSQRTRTLPLIAERGSIFDRNGIDLAVSVAQTTIWANPKLISDPLAAANELAPILQQDPLVLRDKLTRPASFVYLARKVPDDVANAVRALKMNGVFFVDEPKRFLPAGGLAAPVLGEVGTDNTGLGGLESMFDERLAGSAGQMVIETDPGGRAIAGGSRRVQPSARGDDLVLTLDVPLQHATEQALSDEIVRAHGQGGMAIVMNTQTGEIVSMANLSVDHADGDKVVPAANNMALTNVYEPGSVNKLITIAGALQEGVIHPNDHLTVPGELKVADTVFRENEPHPTQSWSITDIVANSSNIGTIMIGKELGKARIDKYVRTFGFGKRTAVNFPGESPGIILDPDKWSGTSIATVPIGQGIAVTAMQMLAAYNTVANDGVYVSPKLVLATVDSRGRRHATPPSARRRVVSPAVARQVTAMLSEVVRVGTGQQAHIDGYTVAGKTGTARKPLDGAVGYKAGAYVSSFAGFVPAERPALSAIVILDEPTPIYGGLVSAPVFAQLAQYALREFRIPPPAAQLATEVPKSSPSAANSVGEATAPIAPTTTTTTTTPTAPASTAAPASAAVHSAVHP